MLSGTHAAVTPVKATPVSAAVTAALSTFPSTWRAQPIAQAVKVGGGTSSWLPTPSATPNIIPGSSTPGPGKTPNQMRTAYGLGNYGSSTVTFAGIQGDGRGQTIAIVDAYDDPNAATDLNTFSTQFGLPTVNTGGPTFTKLNQTGGTTLPGTDPAGPESVTGNSTWEGEESLDIEWAHATAPMANIILFEANDNSGNLYTAVTTAAAYSGVVAVSMSFGGGEFSGESTYDNSFFSTPSGHIGVTFLASTGDSGTEVEFPAVSANVVAVGGTSLTTGSGGAYTSETGWSGSGGGVSLYEPQPSYQASTVSAYSTTFRAVPDVAIDANPSTGVPIVDSWDYGTSTPWIGGGYVEGGTSLACPLWAGLIAVTDQGRVANGLSTLNGKTQTLPQLYGLPSTDFHDITTINNGSTVKNAGVGYDLNTGRGSPISNTLIPDLVGAPTTGTVAGRVFRDANANGTFDGTDTGLASQTVYLDENNDGTRQSTEPTATTDASGNYSFTGIASGITGSVRLLTVPTGYVVVANPTFTVTSGGTSTANLGLFPTAYTDATGSDAWTLRVNPSLSTQLQILVNGTVTYSAATTLPTALTFTFTGAADSLTVDYTNGVPVPTGGVTLNGTAAANNDKLLAIGTSAADTIISYTGSLSFDSRLISYSNVPNLSLDPKGGTDALYVNSGAASIPAQTAGGGVLSRTFSTLSVGGGATLAIGNAAARSDRTVLVVTPATGLTVNGQLNLGGNDMIVKSGTLTTVAGLVTNGFASGTWAGTGGIASSVAAANTGHTTGLAVVPNLANSAALFTTFDGQAVTTADVLLKYTYYGDTNLSGNVTAADYTRADAGFIASSTGWLNGDFNYDGVVDGSDYTLLDNAFNQQSTTL